jgi:thymidine phosphorylase
MAEKNPVNQVPTDIHVMRARRLGIDTQNEAVIFLRQDSHVCHAEGFLAHTRIEVRHAGRAISATLYQVTSSLLRRDEAGLSEAAWRRLGVVEDGPIAVGDSRVLESLGAVRGKVYGRPFDEASLRTVIEDVTAGRYSDIYLSSFITACSARPFDFDEMVWLTRAMVGVGDVLHWPRSPIMDKHSVGGLPGNRTTPIVVAIAAACGLTIPKTSSRSITSPAGTADTMETMAPVDLNSDEMRKVVEKEGGCIVWGGAVHLSPADDILIRVERALDLDSEGQLVASVLSKKIAAGSTHLVLDMPVGPTAKVRGAAAAAVLTANLMKVSEVFGLTARVLQSDGSQPVGHGIGPALEARDVLAVLQDKPGAPSDLRAKSLALAGALLELSGATTDGATMATHVLRDGRAWRKFQSICEAQGGMRTPPQSSYRHPVLAQHSGTVVAIDNRRIARVAKLAGAPDMKASGVEMHCRVGTCVETGQPLYSVHTEAPGEMDYVLGYVAGNLNIVMIGDA